MLYEVASFIGTIALAVVGATGSYVWLRWGWRGVRAIWSKRDRLDDLVDRDIERTVGY